MASPEANGALDWTTTCDSYKMEFGHQPAPRGVGNRCVVPEPEKQDVWVPSIKVNTGIHLNTVKTV